MAADIGVELLNAARRLNELGEGGGPEAGSEGAKEVAELLGAVASLPVTAGLLKSTKAGLAVGKYRSHGDAEVARLSKAAVAAWKARISKPGTPKAAKTGPAGKSAKSARSSSSSGAKQRAFKLGLPDPTRSRVQKMIHDAMHEPAGDGGGAVSRVEAAVRVEEAIFARFKSSTEYKGKVRELLPNLRSADNAELSHNMYSGLLRPEDLAELSGKELASSIVRQQRAADAREAIEKRRSDWEDEHQTLTTVSLFTCGKCKKQMCTYYQLQTRSADEPMTTFIRCANCGNQWRE